VYLFGQAEIDAAQRVLARRQLFRYAPDASEAVSFEQELAARMGIAHAVAVSSGTAGLICALAALGIGPGDEVIVPAYGYVADPLAVVAVGAVPVICEVDDTLTIDARDLARRIGPRTRAVIPIHMNGFPCNMDAVLAVARRHELKVVEDACQAIGGRWRGRILGTMGDLGVFSFNQFKILTAGEGGAVITGDRTLYERTFIAHDGSCGHSPHTFGQPMFAGLAFRIGEVAAAILRAQLQRLDRILALLRASRDRIVDILGEGDGGMRRVPCHDPEGECATTVAYRFPGGDAADEFCRRARAAGVAAFRGDAYLHSYAEWGFLWDRLGTHHAGANPLAAHAFDAGACPATARILRETVLLACGPDADERALATLSRQLQSA
jgi:dTDP-4-amino-4,6-dideoxygalactose transaminase